MPELTYEYPTNGDGKESTKEAKEIYDAINTKNYKKLDSEAGWRVWQDELKQFERNMEVDESDWGMYLESRRR